MKSSPGRSWRGRPHPSVQTNEIIGLPSNLKSKRVDDFQLSVLLEPHGVHQPVAVLEELDADGDTLLCR